MADYNRFISYIYLYENGVKTKNTGFAKVESRDGRCYVDVCVKGIHYREDMQFSVYMFVRQPQRLAGIYLGDLAIENGTGTFERAMDAENIADSGYSLSQMSGMIIRDAQGGFFGTGWDDEMLDVGRFAVRGSNKGQAIIDEPVLCKAEMAATVPLHAASVSMVSDMAVDNEDLSDDDKEAEAVLETITEPEFDKEPIREPEPDREPVQELKPVRESLQEPETVKKAIQEAEPVKEPTWESQQQSLPLAKLLDQGLRMYPFEDDQIAVCIRLELQDIGMLPVKYWTLASNSFVLNSYYSYRHLIMAQMKDGTFILGIPGINYQKEYFMAVMFGFHKFKSIQKQAVSAGSFGYWYMELEPEEAQRSVEREC